MIYLMVHNGCYRMANPDLELVVKRTTDEDRIDNQHLRFEQYQKGNRVVGGDLVSHLNSACALKLAKAFYQPDVGFDPAAVTSSHGSSIYGIDFTGPSGLADADINESGGPKPTGKNVSRGDMPNLFDHLCNTGPSPGPPD